MKRTAALLAVLLLVSGAAGAVVADEGPLADAGLDQEVSQNTTVQLDGTGSSHPDGTIDAYEWSIETPTGRTITPDCPDCARTTFEATEVGRYEVTLTVTDTEGRTDSDTLYVDVEAAGPTVDLSGPTTPRVDQPRRFNATAGTTNAELRNLTWRVGNHTVATAPLSGETDASEQTFTFDDEGPYRLTVIVIDSRNRTGRDTLVIRPRSPGPDNESNNPDSPSRDGSSSSSGDSDIGPNGSANESTRDEDLTCPTTGVGIIRRDSGDNAITCVHPGANNDETGDKTAGLKPEGFDGNCEAYNACNTGGGNPGGTGTDSSNGDNPAPGSGSIPDAPSFDSGEGANGGGSSDGGSNDGNNGEGSSEGTTGFT